MKKITHAFHLLLSLSLVLLPMRAVLADFSVIPMGVEMGAEMQVADHHVGSQSHHDDVDFIAASTSHEMLMAEHVQMHKSSTDCHDHNMTDCEACALHFALKKDIGISELSISPTSYTDYSVPVVTLVLSSKIRPPIYVL
jgi:hypothetical protein